MTDEKTKIDGSSELKSPLVGVLSGLPAIDRIIRLIKQAGAPKESTYERDGFLSYHAESHAAGAGIGLGFAILASGELRYLGVLLQVVLFGNRGEKLLEPKLLGDVKQERHYFLGGLVTGAVFGLLARLAVGTGIPGVGSVV